MNVHDCICEDVGSMLLLILIVSRFSTLIWLEIWSRRIASWLERGVLIECQIAYSKAIVRSDFGRRRNRFICLGRVAEKND